MIKKLIYLLLLLSVFNVAYCQDLDEEIGEGVTFEDNKHYPRVNVVPYDNDKVAKSLKYKESSAYKSLNGSWQFALKIGEVIGRQDVNIDSLNVASWSSLNVPGCWQTNGKQIKALPLKNMLSVQSVENPVGLYFKEIEIGEEWKVAAVLIVLLIVNYFNPLMNFIDNTPAHCIIWALCVLCVIHFIILLL